MVLVLSSPNKELVREFPQLSTMIAVSLVTIPKRIVHSRETSKQGDPLHQAWKQTTIRGRRSLMQNEDFDVPLFLELQFLNTTTVEQLEQYNVESEPILHLCSCVAAQVSKYLRAIVRCVDTIYRTNSTLTFTHFQQRCSLRQMGQL